MKQSERYSVHKMIYLVFLVAILSSCTGITQNSSRSQSDQVTPLPVENTKTAIACQKEPLPGPDTEAVQVTVHTKCPLLKSQMSLGVTHIDNTLMPFNSNVDAFYRAKELLRQGVQFQNTHIMGWGAPDPWPDPSSPEPTEWGNLDARLQTAVEAENTPVISLATAPWWMKGQYVGKGQTRALTSADEWKTKAYESRPMDNKMDAWLHLVQRVAERYMVAPYNVRYFQVWNEMKGYYNPDKNIFDYTTSPGDPSGPNARHGYTYMYNRVYLTIMGVADDLGIPRNTVKIGGPYVFMDTWSSRNVQSNPSNIRKLYGVLDQRPLDVIQYWLQNKIGAGFLTFDGSMQNRDGKKLTTDPFTASEKFADVVKWVRSLDPQKYKGADTLPVWLAEWFASQQSDEQNNDYDNAVKTYTIMQFLKASGGVALAWGGSGDGTSDQGLWSTAEYYDGGIPHPWYDTARSFKNDFPPGTQIYDTTVSEPQKASVLASGSKVMLLNKTNAPLTVSVGGNKFSLTPYQVMVVDYSAK